MTWVGDDSLVWGITLEADLDRPALPLLDRVAALPVPTEVASGDAMSLAGRAFSTPLRVAADGSRITIAADHHRVDGLGLLGVLGALLGQDVTSNARGLGDRPPRPFVRSAAERLREAAIAPPEPVAFTGTRRPGPDGLSTQAAAGPIGNGALVAAAISAVRRWNRAHGAPDAPLAVAVGASRRSGSAPTIEDASAYLRLRAEAELTAAEVSALLNSAAPEPGADQIPSSGGLGRLAARVSRRLGSTLLVSHLGTVRAPGVLSLAFAPVTGGRSGVSLGAVTLHGTTTLTLRSRPGTLSPTDRDDILRLITG